MQTPSGDGFEYLSGSSLTAGMTQEQVRVLAGCGTPENYPDGETLVKQGANEFDLLVLVEGKCEIRTTMDDILYRLGPHSLIGEMSFLDHKPRSAKAIAIGDCRAIRFPSTLLEDLEATRPDIVAKLLKNIGVVLVQKLRSTTRFAEASFV